MDPMHISGTPADTDRRVEIELVFDPSALMLVEPGPVATRFDTPASLVIDGEERAIESTVLVLADAATSALNPNVSIFFRMDLTIDGTPSMFTVSFDSSMDIASADDIRPGFELGGRGSQRLSRRLRVPWQSRRRCRSRRAGGAVRRRPARVARHRERPGRRPRRGADRGGGARGGPSLRGRAEPGRGDRRGGLNVWIDRREDGLGRKDLARAFLRSEEFEAAFGDPETLGDRALVEVLYRNVLNREGEAGGIGFWTTVVGGPCFDRADLLLAFAASPENVAGSPFVETLTETAPGEWSFA